MRLRKAKYDVKVLKWVDGSAKLTTDTVIGEEPLIIQAQGPSGKVERVTTTLRTPGDDFALAVGLAVSEGFYHPSEIVTAKYCLPRGQQQDYNTVTILTRCEARTFPPELRTVSCGWCNSEALIARADVSKVNGTAVEVSTSPEELFSLLELLEEHQSGFKATGAAHAALLHLPDGVTIIGEDVGRHNALDKAIGKAILESHPMRGAIVLLSGRAGVDLVAKAAAIGSAVVAAVSAPTSLAIEYAAASGITLIGFLRQQRLNVYSHYERFL